MQPPNEAAPELGRGDGAPCNPYKSYKKHYNLLLTIGELTEGDRFGVSSKKIDDWKCLQLN